MSRSSEPPPAPGELDEDIEACRQLSGLSATDTPAEADRLEQDELGAMRAELGAMIDREPVWRSRLWHLGRGQRVALLTTVAVLATAAVAALLPRADLAAYPWARMVATLAVMAALFVAASFALLRPLHLPEVPASRTRGLLLATVLLPLLWLALPLDYVGHPPGDGLGFVVASLKCLLFGAVFGAPLMIFALAARRADVGGMVLAALAGVAGGLTGNLVLQVHCPITDAGHLLTGHGLLIPLLLLVSASPMRRFLQQRRGH